MRSSLGSCPDCGSPLDGDVRTHFESRHLGSLDLWRCGRCPFRAVGFQGIAEHCLDSGHEAGKIGRDHEGHLIQMLARMQLASTSPNSVQDDVCKAGVAANLESAECEAKKEEEGEPQSPSFVETSIVAWGSPCEDDDLNDTEEIGLDESVGSTTSSGRAESQASVQGSVGFASDSLGELQCDEKSKSQIVPGSIHRVAQNSGKRQGISTRLRKNRTAAANNLRLLLSTESESASSLEAAETPLSEASTVNDETMTTLLDESLDMGPPSNAGDSEDDDVYTPRPVKLKAPLKKRVRNPKSRKRSPAPVMGRSVAVVMPDDGSRSRDGRPRAASRCTDCKETVYAQVGTGFSMDSLAAHVLFTHQGLRRRAFVLACSLCGVHFRSRRCVRAHLRHIHSRVAADAEDFHATIPPKQLLDFVRDKWGELRAFFPEVEGRFSAPSLLLKFSKFARTWFGDLERLCGLAKDADKESSAVAQSTQVGSFTRSSCTTCGKPIHMRQKSILIKTLLQHTVTHSEATPLSCASCPFTTKTRHSMSTHQYHQHQRIRGSGGFRGVYFVNLDQAKFQAHLTQVWEQMLACFPIISTHFSPETLVTKRNLFESVHFRDPSDFTELAYRRDPAVIR